MNPITALYVSITMALHGAADRLKDDEGQTSVEWIGISAVIVAIIGVFLTFREPIGQLLNSTIQGLIGEAAATS